MEINFFDNPADAPKSREDVRLRALGLYLHEDRKRVSVGFDLTPFIERPCIEVTAVNDRGERAGSLHVIDTLDANFSLVMHLRDKAPTELYQIQAVIYYATPETERMNVHTFTRTLDRTKVGEQ
ncbi:MAG: hypothetical protein KC419_24135 [Anaerolineales bacterium]|nr:hypothetical protein [Anaerolineales bacterium]MCA9931604.1 hypothetical protein [Anaerolineales bacterium]